MIKQAETMECEACLGTGITAGSPMMAACATCSGTGVRTTGAVVNATGHDGCIRGLDEAKGTIAAQAAEIEAMKSVIGRISPENTSLRVAVDRLKGELRTSQEQYGAYADELKIVIADRNVLRLEVQRLKDLSHESQDLYAALEAERDELRAEAERLKLRLTESLVELGAAEKEIAHMRESNGRADDYSAKLERVVEAVNANAATMVNVLIAMANAGLPMPNYVPFPTKEADNA